MQRSGRTVCMIKTHKTARVQFGTTQQFVKSGQIRDARPKMGQIGVPGDLWFFPGLGVKNMDCPGKSGTDGHLMHYIIQYECGPVFRLCMLRPSTTLTFWLGKNRVCLSTTHKLRTQKQCKQSNNIQQRPKFGENLPQNIQTHQRKKQRCRSDWLLVNTPHRPDDVTLTNIT